MGKKPKYEELEKKVEELERAAIEFKQHEKDLKIYKNIVSSTIDGISLLDRNYRYLIVNDAYESFSGVNREQFIGLTVAEYLGEDVFEKHIKPHFDRCLQGEVVNYQEWFEYPTLGKKFIDVSYYPYRDSSSNRITSVIVNCRDITERKEAEEALSKSQQIIEGIINAIPVGVFWKDKNLVFLGCNTIFAHDAGFADPKDIIGKDDYQMVWRDQAELYCGDDYQVIESGVSKLLIEEPQTTPEGNTITVLTSRIPLRSSTGEIVGVLGTYMDITERKQAEDKLKKRIKELNCFYGMAALLELPGISLDKILKRTLMLIPPAWQFPEITAVRIVLDEQSFQTKNFRETPWMQACEVIVHGKPVGQVEVCYLAERQAIDEGPFMIEERHLLNTIAERLGKIIERMKAEEALKISRENLLEESNQRKILSKRLIDLLEKDRHDIAMELHDNIGQILTSLKINLEVIDDKLKPIDTELGSLTKDAIKRANQAINDLHNIAQGLMPSILDALGLVSSLRALLNEFREHTDIKIKFFNRNVPKRFDQEKELAIYRIVQEALNNIIKHAKAKNVHVSLLKKGNVLFLSVEDDGVGFDQDKKMKISKGKGPLGLVIMQERAMQLDGELTIESSLGKGTHLLAEIPI